MADSTYTVEQYEGLLDSVEDIASNNRLGFKILTDRRTGEHSFMLYEGNDTTANNVDNNPPCVFSQDYDNVLEQEYTKSTETYRNTAYVTGEEPKDDSNEEQVVIQLNDDKAGLERNEVLISAGNVKKEYKDANNNDVTMTDEEYSTAITNMGKDKLYSYGVNQSFSSEINTLANLRYREDYDLGDKVTCINRRWNIKIDARITEIEETYEVGKIGIEVTFGDSTPSLYKQIQSMIK